MADEPTGTEPVEDAEPDQPVDEPQEPAEQKLNKVQLQQISSVVGSIVKKAIEKDVMPLMSQPREPESYATPDNPAYQKFNERLSERLFSGDVAGALQDYLNVHEKANKNLSQKQKTELNRHISSYEDRPYYKDVYAEVDKRAKEYVANGYPPGPAADLAYEKSVNAFLMSKAPDNSGSLAMESGGRRSTKTQGSKLPPQFEKAYQQGKEKGLFKDRNEYIENLDPRVRQTYGIE